MTRYHHHHHRAALALAAAAATLLAGSHARAQMLGQNIFGGNNGANPTTLSTTNATLVTGQGNSGTVGPGFAGTVMLGVGAADTLTETLNANNSGTLTAGESGPGVINVLGNPTGAGVGGTFSATKPITAMFAPGQSYAFTLTTTTNSALSLLSGFNVAFTTVDTGVTTTVYSASGGVGLLGVAQVINLFGGGTQATFDFTAPANVDTTVPITITVSGRLTTAALGNTFTFSNATLVAVPEPGTVGALAVGMAGLALLRCRHRLAA